MTWFSLTFFNSTQAQITLDNTLGAESSVITPNQNIKGITSDQMNGGAIRGVNLFHSFTQFNISEGQAAYFSNPNGIQNILTRVTGNNPSSISKPSIFSKCFTLLVTIIKLLAIAIPAIRISISSTGVPLVRKLA